MFQFALPYREAIKIAKKLAHSISTEETRYYLNGIFIHKTDGKHIAVSTDGHMLSKIELLVDDSYEGEFPSVIFPAQVVKQIEQIKLAASEKKNAVVLISIDANALRYEIDCRGQTSGGRLIDGHFPDYTRVIPADWKSFTNEYGGQGFSPLYLAAIMKAASFNAETFKADTRPVRMFFQGGNAAIIQETDPAVLYIIMPLRAAFPQHKHPVAQTETANDTEGAAA
jgi:DNA polymerase III sliding clamp (beta) subunit (PCNA family)